MRKALITITFIAVFCGFYGYQFPTLEEAFQSSELNGIPVHRQLEYWNFFVSNLLVSGGAASGAWWLSRKR
jgi:hypothetical protein